MHLLNEPLKLLVRLSWAVLFLLFGGCSGSQAYLDKFDAAPNAIYTSDIEFGPEVTGTASRSKLFGFIEWGDSNYFSLRDLDRGQMNIANQNTMTRKVAAAAAHNALDGSPESIIVDPQLRIKESNFLVFKKYKATVYGHSAQKTNFRQIKRFNTDGTETLPLSAAPQEYRLFRDGNETIRISATNNLRSSVAETIRVFDRSEDPLKGSQLMQPLPSQELNPPPHVTNTIQVFDSSNKPVERIEVQQSDSDAPPPLIQPEAAVHQFKHPVIQNVYQRQQHRKLYLLRRSD